MEVPSDLPAGAMQGCIAFFAGAWRPLRKTPFKAFGAQDQSGMGWLFLWILSFGHAKESISAVAPKPDFKIKAVALATLSILLTLTLSSRRGNNAAT
jgi:hypothetical protein